MTMPLNAVRILITGGTLDKVHDPLTEGLGFVQDGTSHLPGMLRTARCEHPAVQQVMLKDSLDFEETDREVIREAIEAAPEQAIVITHGTSTMGQTARWLAERITGKTVVLTGAMRPYSFGMSDGSFNLGGAVIAAQLLGHGVYGAMNGRVFEAQDLEKDTQAGRFDL